MTQEKYDHTILIVDDDEQVGKAVGRILKSMGVAFIYAKSGQTALEHIKSAEKPISLILSDQRMMGMQGSDFLAHAKEYSPETIRFLFTGYSDVDAITAAVNKGSIHRYITKPWDNKLLMDAILNGLNQHELIMESQRLFKLAKEQNAKLYKLNIDLKERTADHKKSISQLNLEIETYSTQLKKESVNRGDAGELELFLRGHNFLEKEQLESLYTALLCELYAQFQDIAIQNKFEMPEKIVSI